MRESFLEYMRGHVSKSLCRLDPNFDILDPYRGVDKLIEDMDGLTLVKMISAYLEENIK